MGRHDEQPSGCGGTVRAFQSVYALVYAQTFIFCAPRFVSEENSDGE